MSEILVSFWPWLSSAVLLGIDLWATGHVVLFKRHTRSAIGWVGLIWLVPFAGPILSCRVSIGDDGDQNEANPSPRYLIGFCGLVR